MDSATANRLLKLNRQFYQTFAAQFSATRMRLQPGVGRILARIPLSARLLDLGCGNGELWHALQAAGFRGSYVGLDFSAELLEIARTPSSDTAGAPPTQDKNGPSPPTHERSPGQAPGAQAIFLQADLASEGWDAALPFPRFDLILAFAVLHHLPSRELHLRVLRAVRRLLPDEGIFYHSEWQFLNSVRLRARIQPWEALGLSASRVEPGDYLLDWRAGGYGLRYVHHFSQSELAALATESGFQVVESFSSDGKGGNLALYQAWRPSSALEIH